MNLKTDIGLWKILQDDEITQLIGANSVHVCFCFEKKKEAKHTFVHLTSVWVDTCACTFVRFMFFYKCVTGYAPCDPNPTFFMDNKWERHNIDTRAANCCWDIKANIKNTLQTVTPTLLLLIFMAHSKIMSQTQKHTQPCPGSIVLGEWVEGWVCVGTAGSMAPLAAAVPASGPQGGTVQIRGSVWASQWPHTEWMGASLHSLSFLLGPLCLLAPSSKNIRKEKTNFLKLKKMIRC